MKLYYSKRSPFVRKVMMVAHEANMAGSLELIPTDTKVPPAELLLANPLGKIPCLLPDDGPALFDSRVICEYLDQRFNEGRLIPSEPEARVAALRWQALADGIMDAAVLCRYESLRPEAQRSDKWLEWQQAKIRRALDTLEGEIETLKGAPFSIANLAIAAALGYLDLRLESLRWREPHPKLAAWYSTVRERPSVGRTDPIALP